MSPKKNETLYRCKVGFAVLFTEIERGESFGAGQLIEKERHDELVGYRDEKGLPVVDPEWFEETTEQREEQRAAQERRKADERNARLKAFHAKRAADKEAKTAPPAAGTKPASTKQPDEDGESEAK